MSNPTRFLNNKYVKKFFKDELDLDEEEFNRRLQMYLEIYPFLVLDFRLREECKNIHKSMKINNSSGHVTIQDSEDLDDTFNSTLSKYRNKLIELRDKLTEIDFTVGEE